jgi:hypothetical protein
MATSSVCEYRRRSLWRDGDCRRFECEQGSTEQRDCYIRDDGSRYTRTARAARLAGTGWLQGQRWLEGSKW